MQSIITTQSVEHPFKKKARWCNDGCLQNDPQEYRLLNMMPLTCFFFAGFKTDWKGINKILKIIVKAGLQ